MFSERCLDRRNKTQRKKKLARVLLSGRGNKMQGLASPPRLRWPRASSRRSIESRRILGPDSRPRATEGRWPATTQSPSDCDEALPSPSPATATATAPLGSDGEDAGSSSSDPSQSRRATLIAGGVAAGTWDRNWKKGGKREVVYALTISLSRPFRRPSLSPSKKKKKLQRPSLPRPAPPEPSSPSPTPTPSLPSPRATLSESLV